MRKFSAAIKTLIAAGNPSSFFLVKLVAPSATFLDTSAPIEITVPTIGTFSPTGGLATVDVPRISETVDRESYKVGYIDPDFEKISLFEAGLTGSSLKVWLCFWNTSGATLNGILPGQPMTAVEDLIVAYAGTVDTQAYTVDPKEGTVTAVVEASSPMGSLGQVRAYYTSKETLKHSHPGDTSFDEIYVGSKKVAILWGKESIK